MRKSVFGVAGLLSLALFLSGCSTIASSKKVEEVKFSDADPGALALNESALRIARAAEQAALGISVGGQGKRNTAVTQEFKIDMARLPKELRDPVLLESGFHGELEPFVRSLTDLMAWSIVVVGNKPTIPIIVSLSEQRRPPAEWLADAGYQAGGQADVILNPAIKQAVIKYKD